MKRIVSISVCLILVAGGLFAGDAAAFVDLGFSKDGKIYVFGQYGKTDKDFHGYGEIYTVDVKKNDFVSSGVFKAVDKSGRSGQGVFANLKDKHGDFLSRYSLSPVEADSILYLREDTSKPSTADIVFKDFNASAAGSEVFYTVRLVPMYEGRGRACKSSFYIVAERKTADGKVLSRFVAGNPEIQRKGVTGYAIDRIYTAPDGKGMVFVVEKTVEDSTGTSIRYMVETVALADASQPVPAAAPILDK